MRAFWHLGVVTLFQNAAISTICLYAIPYLTSLGMDRSTASTVVMLYTLVSLFTRIPMGMLSDIFRKSYVMALSVALQGVGLFLFWLIGGTSPFWLILLFAIIYGFGVSGVMPLRAPILSGVFWHQELRGYFWSDKHLYYSGERGIPAAGRMDL